MRPTSHPEDTGRPAFREPDESPDARPVIGRRQFWRDVGEASAWLYAVEECRRFRARDDFAAHLERICRTVGRPARVRDMPRLPYRDPDDPEPTDIPVELTDARDAELKRQAAAIVADAPPRGE